ncbi:MAG: ribonuclease H-like domain-containing protein [Clostridia bacterium]|nr:ribonuclease H-like domain-containing protein [Clostridia bacterium]
MDKILIDELNKFTNNEYKFALKSALLQSNADFCVIEIFYKDGILLSIEKKEELQKLCLEILPKAFKYEIVFIKNFINEERIENDFNAFMQGNFPSISYAVQKIALEDMKFSISLKIDKFSYEHAKNKNLNGCVEKYLKKLYEDYDFSCSLEKAEVFVQDETELLKQNYKEDDVDIFANRKIEISNIVPIVGDLKETIVPYVVDKTVPEENVVLCGTIKNIKPIVIKRKPKQTAAEVQEGEKNQESAENQGEVETEENEELEDDEKTPKYQRKLYKFTLEDFTGKMECVFFSNKETQAKAEKLDVGSIISVRGNLEEDKFSKGVVMSVKEISYCSLPENFEEYIEWKKEKPFYEYVEPEKVVIYRQDDLMSFANEDVVCDYLKNNTFVCFDFETTGLNYGEGDRIIEIGAVKIENGVITEKFMTYVDPEKPIPAKASEISGIVDSDVAGAPKDYEALQDFYKFTRGAILTGYNIIGFDMLFLRGQGKTCRWNFDNEVIDTYKLAQKYVHGVRNYKLGTIAEKLGVLLENAHRAVFDALATAEVFLKLAPNIS